MSPDRFRLAFCQLELLKGCRTDRQLKNALDDLPKTLDATYDRIFADVEPDDVELVRRVMIFLAFSIRPMTIQEIAEGVAFDAAAERFLDEDRLYQPFSIVELCTSLVSIQDTGSDAEAAFKEERGIRRYSVIKDPEQQILQFSHFTVKEYLKDATRRKDPKSITLDPVECHVQIAKMCLVYLLEFNEGKQARQFDHKENPLLGYAARYWPKHWKQIPLQGRKAIEPLLLRLFDPESSESLGNYVNLSRPLATDGLDRSDWHFSRGTIADKATSLHGMRWGSALYYACYLELEDIVIWVLDKHQRELQQSDLSKALAAAAVRGNYRLVDRFLALGMDANDEASINWSISQLGRIKSALQAAATSGDSSTVQTLVKSGAAVNYRGDSGGALHLAVRGGYKDIVKILLEAGANPNVKGNELGLPLTDAAAHGDDELVLLLLDRGADPNVIDGWHYDRPLSAACHKCSLETVRALLEKGATPINCHALCHAAERGDIDIMRLVLENGADVNKRGGVYGVPLQYAIHSGSQEAFEFLLAQKADINFIGGSHGSCLAQAIYDNNQSAVDRLLELGAVVEDQALIDAIEKKRPDLVKTLLRAGANPNSQTSMTAAEWFGSTSYNGRTLVGEFPMPPGSDIHIHSWKYGSALQIAMEADQPQIVKILLDAGADPNPATPSGEYGYPLHTAAADDEPYLLRLLLERGADIGATGGRYNTALVAAVATQCTQNVDILLEAGADINVQGGTYGSAVRAALGRGDRALTKKLLDRGADVCTEQTASHVISKVSRYGTVHRVRFAIEVAVAVGDMHLVRSVLEADADINCGNVDGVLVLKMAAAWAPDPRMIAFVLKHGADAKRYGAAALQEAIHHPHIIQQLLDAGANPCSDTDLNVNILQHAIYYDEHETVKILIAAGADVNAVTPDYGTALCSAISAGQDVAFLLAAGADPNITGGHLYGSPLIAAAARGDRANFDALLAAGARPDLLCPTPAKAAPPSYATALDAACRGSHWDMATELLARGADPRAGYPLVNLAAAAAGSAQAAMARRLLGYGGVDVDAVCPRRGSALQHAAYHGNAALAEQLLGAGASADKQGGWLHCPLTAAVAGRHARLVARLLAAGADVDAVGGRWGTALQCALWHGDEDVVDMLLGAGADVSASGGELYGSPLQVAARYGGVDRVQQLLDLGAEVNTTCGWYGSPLQAAAKAGDEEKVRLLLKAGADVNLEGGKHGFALQAAAAAHKDNSEVLRLLLEAGADVNASGGRYGTALAAAAYHRERHVEILLKHGAKAGQEGGWPGSPLRAAKMKASPRIVELLVQNGAVDDGWKRREHWEGREDEKNGLKRKMGTTMYFP
jgi:ankyrin repeat protein